jgi:hypothetical protein
VTAVKAYWLGGPADGSLILINEESLDTPIKVLTGTYKRPQKRYVTPRLDGEKWVLPFYEGRIVEETR